MQIVIDISEHIYNLIAKGEESRDFVYKSDLMRAVLEGTPLPKEHNGKNDVLDKIIGYIDHIRNTGMGKKKSLEFIEKFIEGLKTESEVQE